MHFRLAQDTRHLQDAVQDREDARMHPPDLCRAGERGDKKAEKAEQSDWRFGDSKPPAGVPPSVPPTSTGSVGLLRGARVWFAGVAGGAAEEGVAMVSLGGLFVGLEPLLDPDSGC